MTDRELLELAAKAAGLHFHGHRETKTIAAAWVSKTGSTDDWFCWNPLSDDGDALRLANKLWLEIRHVHGKAHAGTQGKFWCTEPWYPDGNQDAATRRAIVRAAAEIGKAMP